MHFKLAIRFSGKLLENYEFDKDVVTIGRAPDCDVIIDNLGVSRVHAVIERTGDVFVLKDSKSNNGTFVRGERIQRYNLNHMEEFFVGKHSITFMYAEEPATSDTFSSASDKLSSLLVGEETTKEDVSSKKEENHAGMQVLTMYIDPQDVAIIGGKKGGTPVGYFTTNTSGIRQQTVIDKTATFFGTDPKCEYQIKGWLSSKRHVLLLREESCFRLIHLGNHNPPKLNGVEVDDQKLKEGDVLDIENYRLVFHLGRP